MFKVRKSIKRFRDDPAWTYRRKAPDYLATFDRGGYPFVWDRRATGSATCSRAASTDRR